MKFARLSIITENQNTTQKAERLAKMICETIGIETSFIIGKYEKFENSYKLEFVVEFEDPKNSIFESLEKTDRLCFPWVVKLNRRQNEIELTFNKSANATYLKNDFNVIVWGNWEVDEK